MERFIHARDIEKDEPDKMVDICEVGIFKNQHNNSIHSFLFTFALKYMILI